MGYSESMKVFIPEWWCSLPHESKVAVYNGTGPDFFPGWIRDLLDTIYHWASDPVSVHDVEYNYSSCRIMADLRLLANCILCGGLAPRRVVLSAVAFAAVLFFGWRAWKEGHNHAN